MFNPFGPTYLSPKMTVSAMRHFRLHPNGTICLDGGWVINKEEFMKFFRENLQRRCNRGLVDLANPDKQRALFQSAQFLRNSRCRISYIPPIYKLREKLAHRIQSLEGHG